MRGRSALAPGERLPGLGKIEMGTKAGTKIARYEKAHHDGGLKSLIYMVGPHGLEPWTKGL